MTKLQKLALLLAALCLLSGCGAKTTASASTGHCTISISCQTLAAEPELCTVEKRELIPADGWLLAEQSVEFYEGESVFDVLLRLTQAEKLHLEYSQTPAYQAVYIEGIGNLYEFDAGPLSGWMYSVNGYFPNYGCGSYCVQDGDTIVWVYTCDLGQDVGGAETAGAQIN